MFQEVLARYFLKSNSLQFFLPIFKILSLINKVSEGHEYFDHFLIFYFFSTLKNNNIFKIQATIGMIPDLKTLRFLIPK